MEKQKGPLGSGLGAALNVELRIGELTSALDMLGNALKETGDKAQQLISEAVGKLREAGVQNLKQASEKEGGHGEATEAYKRTVNQLETASKKGDAEADKLLREMNA